MNFWQRLLFILMGKIPELPPCESCETLREQLSFANYDRKILLENVIKLTQPRESQNSPPVDFENLEPIHRGTRYVPWRVKREMLENDSRERARIFNNKPRTTEELERELGINTGVNNGVTSNVHEAGEEGKANG